MIVSSVILAVTQNVSTQKVIVLGNVNFLSLFSNFYQKFYRKLASHIETLGSIQRKGCGKLTCIRDFAQLF